MSLFKFFGDRGGDSTEHRGPLAWPGTAAGFPFRGQTPDLRGDEIEDKVKHVLDYHSAGFALWEPVEKTAFDALMDKIANGWYMVRNRQDHWYPEHRAYFVWLEWLQIYGEHVGSKHPSMEGASYGHTLRVPEPISEEPLPEGLFG